ncbi:MAG: tRNA glutamyl-Q(34) synthetase GluQRS [Gammaproteobacteria bacterium]
MAGQSIATQDYVGRFAPSPTGPLHLGSLIAALASYLQARSRDGQWLVRIEDLDPPREIPGADVQILKTLERYGFEWDGEVLYQSRRQSCYDEALQTLLRDERLYACSCTRKEIAAIARQGEEGPVYPGTCRGKPPSGRKARALRLFTDDRLITFADTVYGAVTQRVETEVGDFVVQRADGLTAYQLAVVVDDALQGVTEVVRGADLLFSTPRQILLQQLLDYPTPDYLHVPLARNAAGEKLSKQTGATALDPSRPGPALMAALTFLGQHPPPGLGEESLETIWEWAIAHWKVAAIPRSETAQTR